MGGGRVGGAKISLKVRKQNIHADSQRSETFPSGEIRERNRHLKNKKWKRKARNDNKKNGIFCVDFPELKDYDVLGLDQTLNSDATG